VVTWAREWPVFLRRKTVFEFNYLRHAFILKFCSTHGI
jgi:hypothetical protein